ETPDLRKRTYSPTTLTMSTDDLSCRAKSMLRRFDYYLPIFRKRADGGGSGRRRGHEPSRGAGFQNEEAAKSNGPPAILARRCGGPGHPLSRPQSLRRVQQTERAVRKESWRRRLRSHPLSEHAAKECRRTRRCCSRRPRHHPSRTVF